METEGEHGGEIVRGEGEGQGGESQGGESQGGEPGRGEPGRGEPGRGAREGEPGRGSQGGEPGRGEPSRRLYLTGERGSEREREETEGVSVR